MLRKTLIALSAVAALGAAASVPTAASAKGLNMDVQFGGGGFGYGGYGPYYGGGYYPDYGPDCFFKKVKVWSPEWNQFVWKTKQVCY